VTSAGEPAVRRTETDDDLLADRMARLIWSTLLAAGRAELADAVADQLGRMPAADLRVRTVLALRVVLAGRMTDGEVDALVRRAVLRDEVSLLDRSDRELMGTVGADDPDRRRRVCGVVAGMVDRVTQTLAAHQGGDRRGRP
jgi:hypothetical protein